MKLLQLVNRTILALVVLVCFSFTINESKVKKPIHEEINEFNSITSIEFCVEINYFFPENRTKAILDYLAKGDLILVKILYRNGNSEGITVKKATHSTETAAASDLDNDLPELIRYMVTKINCNFDENILIKDGVGFHGA
ncbi:hypothetical protein [uncultured Tenacibaculum sp.]|uniref:hypothetical protein n=1 Tax=uncultured Tenacibaculum sp. TaxID=174713 RepID=UPI00260C735E|nr:hypothetical protein [uncultured Tenacibaculum sp.]